MRNWIYVQSSRDLAFPDKIVQGGRGEKWLLKNFWIILKTNYHLTWEFPHVFNRSFRPSEEQRLGKNNFHHRCQRLLSFEEVYFKMS